MGRMQPLVDSALDAFGTIDVLVNNAGTNFFMPAVDMSGQTFAVDGGLLLK